MGKHHLNGWLRGTPISGTPQSWFSLLSSIPLYHVVLQAVGGLHPSRSVTRSLWRDSAGAHGWLLGPGWSSRQSGFQCLEAEIGMKIGRKPRTFRVTFREFSLGEEQGKDLRNHDKQHGWRCGILTCFSWPLMFQYWADGIQHPAIYEAKMAGGQTWTGRRQSNCVFFWDCNLQKLRFWLYSDRTLALMASHWNIVEPHPAEGYGLIWALLKTTHFSYKFGSIWGKQRSICTISRYIRQGSET